MREASFWASFWGPASVYWSLVALKKYAVFSGRACRREFWWFVVTSFAISVTLGLIQAKMAPNTDQGVLAGIYGWAMLIPGIAVTVRRLHDTNLSGWWSLLGVVPMGTLITADLTGGTADLTGRWWLLIFVVLLIGELVLLLFTLKDSQVGDNQYGPNPNEASPSPGSGLLV